MPRANHDEPAMYRTRVANTTINSTGAKRLQNALLAYHDLQQSLTNSPLLPQRLALSAWQSRRLQMTHSDLHSDARFRNGLNFLFSDLYSPQDFSSRDSSLERIFPKMVKWLPESVLDTVAQLVELNHLTQWLDQQLTERLFAHSAAQEIRIDLYCDAYRRCDNRTDRERQVRQVCEAGLLLDRYARSTFLRYSLKISESAAEMAGLAALHQFLLKGFSAFHEMQDVERLMRTLEQRELAIMNRIHAEHPQPFENFSDASVTETGTPLYV
jgi:hypothetical protein